MPFVCNPENNRGNGLHYKVSVSSSCELHYICVNQGKLINSQEYFQNNLQKCVKDTRPIWQVRLLKVPDVLEYLEP